MVSDEAIARERTPNSGGLGIGVVERIPSPVSGTCASDTPPLPELCGSLRDDAILLRKEFL
jgi:hypothetical protein